MTAIITFLIATLGVAAITWWKTRTEKLSTRDGYFLAGRSLNGWVIAGSMMLTNLSAANFTGMTAQVYGANLASIAWTVTVVPPMIFFAAIILPRFIRHGFATVPEYLENRYGASTRRVVTLLFLLSYILSGMPVALYGGAIAIIHLFDIANNLGVSDAQAVWIVVWALGISGGLYALFGGLKGVAVSDTVNGVGLLLGGAMILVFGLQTIGDGNTFDGLRTILTEHKEKLNAVDPDSPFTPFSVLFTGMLLHNLFFWCTNQFIIQRTFGARSLREGQKGVMIASFFKIVNVLYIAVPGVLAFHIYGAGAFENNDWVYPTLVRDIMPSIFVGFFAAVIFGTVLSTFNSVLNSAVTLFVLDLYQPIFGRNLTQDQVVAHGKIAGTIIGAVTLVIAPLFMYAQEGIFQAMVKIDGLFGVPIFLILLFGLFRKRLSGKAANTIILIYVVVYALFLYVIPPPIHFLHISALLFALFFLIAFVVFQLFPAKETPPAETGSASTIEVETTPWRHLWTTSALATLAMIVTYVILSPWGVAG